MQQFRFSDCISRAEKKARMSTFLITFMIYLILAGITVGSFLADALPAVAGYVIIGLISWAIGILVADYQSRLIRAVGARVSEEQFVEVQQAYQEIRDLFGVKEDIPIVIIEASSVNALAVRFARKKMMVLFSEMLVAVQDSPAQLRFFLAHEMCHCVMDHGMRRFFELYKPAKFKCGRELTCDNAGLLAAGSVAETQAALAKLTVGRHLWGKINRDAMVAEAKEITSGLVGYFVGQNLKHPPGGTRLTNSSEFAQGKG